MKQSRIRILTECSILIALASVLSVIKLVDMPYGGSVTPAAMLPILLFAYRHGTKWGLACATIYGVVQQLLGLENLSYFSTWQSVVGIIVLDYIVAYAAVGLGGIFRRAEKNQSLALFYGSILVCLLRYLCHVISGAILWAAYDFALPEGTTVLYSISYNATYMLPEAIILCAAAMYLGSVLDFSRDIPVRVRMERPDTAVTVCRLVGGLLAVFSAVFAVMTVFPALQDPESGEFTFALLDGLNWAVIAPIFCVAVVASAVLFIVSHLREKNNLAHGN
ncbi:MAG: energy-coupled thiamine transporter ThiT [Clostridia bacterium]|nr:energy-coupled thiamine transporter ThiT [Clostridia bacterium]